jgi:hypothetical protein
MLTHCCIITHTICTCYMYTLYIYSIQMADDVHLELLRTAHAEGKMYRKEAVDFFKKMKAEGRMQTDTWGMLPLTIIYTYTTYMYHVNMMCDSVNVYYSQTPCNIFHTQVCRILCIKCLPHTLSVSVCEQLLKATFTINRQLAVLS